MSDIADDFNEALAQAVPIANALQAAVPPGTPTGMVLIALSLMAGVGIASSPDPEVQRAAIQGMITTIVGIVEGGITLDLGTEH